MLTIEFCILMASMIVLNCITFYFLNKGLNESENRIKSLINECKDKKQHGNIEDDRLPG